MLTPMSYPFILLLFQFCSSCLMSNGPFITNGLSQHPQFEDSKLKSNTMTIMFNLNSLNEDRPETMQGHGWEKGCIPKSPNSFIESLV